MSDTTAIHETISTTPTRANIVLEQSGSYYGYLGQDGEGFHHHVDEATNTVYVTTDRAERFLPENAGVYWFRVCGESDHIEELEQDGDRDRWIAYVESVRGWTDRPVHLDVTEVFVKMHEGDRR
ncbi:hypothetical protein [Natrinema hispanicum]|uniref:Uncharacterized protein n=1 Tax=Natrinema hispanicum TaxID=392421 RepID=A0A1G6UT70_9EURY|nr:hypothetical protein [Natrinema hispanicum]SDD43745.1 hypothetical protein SAMN05192552_102318 [Natrinema hispanicum]